MLIDELCISDVSEVPGFREFILLFLASVRTFPILH